MADCSRSPRLRLGAELKANESKDYCSTSSVDDDLAYVEEDAEPNSLDERYFKLEEDDIDESMGVSAMCVLAQGPFEHMMLFSIAAQAFTVQFSILYFMACNLLDRSQDDERETGVPRTVVALCIYLHFMNTFSEAPFYLSVLVQLHHFQETWWEMAICWPLFFVDALLTPFVTLIIGSLVLCKSETMIDVLLNSCAVAFITNIDNWILMLNVKMLNLMGPRPKRTIRLMYPTKTINVTWAVTCLIPIVPGIFAVFMVYLGEDILGL